MVTDAQVNGQSISSNISVYKTVSGENWYQKIIAPERTQEYLIIGGKWYARAYTDTANKGLWENTKSITEYGSIDGINFDASKAKTAAVKVDGKTYTDAETYDDCTYFCYDGDTLSYVYIDNHADIGRTVCTYKNIKIYSYAESQYLQAPADEEIKTAA